MLTLDFNKVLENYDGQVIKKLSDSLVPPNEVVSVHFGETDFEFYNLVI